MVDKYEVNRGTEDVGEKERREKYRIITGAEEATGLSKGKEKTPWRTK